MLAVQATDLHKRYRPVTTWGDVIRGRLQREPVEALRGIDLELGEGELVGLVGPNGSGKSTLLRLVSGLLLPTSGDVRVHGRSPGAGERERRLVGYCVAEERSHFWRLSARQNLEFFAALHGYGGSTARERVDFALDVVDLASDAERLVMGFSTGMRQRLAVARGLLGAPKVLLLDEPTRGLDPKNSLRIHRFVRDTLVAEQGLSVIFATHRVDEMRDLCPRLLLLDEGRIVADGSFAVLGPDFERVFGGAL